MAYIALNKNDKSEIMVMDHRIGKGSYLSGKIGNFLLPFLELDLKEYGNLFDFLSYDRGFDYDDFQTLVDKYPKTSKEHRFFQRLDHNTDEDTLREYALFFLLDNRDTFSNLYENDAFWLSDSLFELVVSDFENLHPKIDFYNIQEHIKSIVDFCFLSNNPKLNGLSPLERYAIFSTTYPAKKFDIINKIALCVLPIDLQQEIRISLSEKWESSKATREETLNLLKYVDSSSIKKIKENGRLVEVYICETVLDFLSVDLMELLKRNASIKKCANCGKLFIPSGKYNTDCCDRIPEGEKYSCKKIMAQKRRKQKVNSDPITKEYEKAYKRMYARINSGTLEKSDFLKWSEEAKQKRDVASQRYAKSKDETIIIDFKKYLGNK